MTWTRLFYIKNMQKAMSRVLPGHQLEQLPISKRYQSKLRKQFRTFGVPWIYDLRELKSNPRDKKPKPKKSIQYKQIRLDKIQKALKENETKQLQFRQQRLNGRPLRGLDKLISKNLQSWIKSEDGAVPEYIKRKREQKNKDDSS